MRFVAAAARPCDHPGVAQAGCAPAREATMADPNERRIAHPVALTFWAALLACLALAVVLLPIYAVP